MRDVVELVRSLGGVASTSDLEERGCSRWAIRLAVRGGALASIRYGWVQAPDAPPDVAAAVLRGGRLTCASAARLLGLWTTDERLHLAAPRHAGRAWRPEDGVVLHWGGARWRDHRQPVEPVVDVLEQLLLCVPREDAIAAIDGALERGLVSMADVQDLIERLPSEYGEVLDLVDPSSESGLESIVRVRLRRMRLSVRTQVRIDGIARVDILVGDRLVIEVDGREFHESRYREDRARDIELLKRGYVVLRLAYAHVMDEWPFVERAIRSLVRQRAHRRRAIAEVDTRRR
jgi:very-short-patch-repair endonuclease